MDRAELFETWFLAVTSLAREDLYNAYRTSLVQIYGRARTNLGRAPGRDQVNRAELFESSFLAVTSLAREDLSRRFKVLLFFFTLKPRVE